MKVTVSAIHEKNVNSKKSISLYFSVSFQVSWVGVLWVKLYGLLPFES